MSEVVSTSQAMVQKMTQMDRSMEEEKAEHEDSLRGMQRLESNVASLMGEMVAKDLKGGVEEVAEKAAALQRSVAELSVKAVQQQQDLVRNTGRMNKVEQDLGRLDAEVEDVQEEQSRLDRVTTAQLSEVSETTGKRSQESANDVTPVKGKSSIIVL